MKRIIPLFLVGAIQAVAQNEIYINFIRQQQQLSGVVWDMPVVPVGEAPSVLGVENGGSLFQLWTIRQSGKKDHLLDQQIVGAYLPAADIKVTTLDPYKPVARTRVDQPFLVEIGVSGLLSGVGLPADATSVLFERHLASYPDEVKTLDSAVVMAGTPFDSAYISNNGSTILKFEASSLTAADPTKASGEEHFVIHALSDGSLTETQLASDFVQIWPIASGSIKGISNGDVLRFQSPQVELLLNDLYPRSDTYLMLFEGTQTSGVEGKIITAFPMDRETSESHVLRVSDFDSHFTQDGEYTIVLVSDTIYGHEMLCPPVTFTVNRTLHMNATQVTLGNQ
jgi:hypothetical protein